MMTQIRTFFRSFAFAALPAIGFAAQSPLGDLIPEPQCVEARAGFAGKDALASVREIDGPVAGAPAAVADEAYVLEVAPDGVTVTANARAGRLNARKTLAQLMKLADGKVPCCRITDWPFVKWRGCMIDTARNFLDLESVRDLIDVMAAYKLNLFHWHLTEYYAWRLESRKYPRLSKEGFHDPFGNRSAGKIYTQEEFRGIVDYAWERGVTVMPEFDVPGHTYAFRKAFGFGTMADPGVKETVCDLLEELCALEPKERMPFVHIGGDEVWSEEEKVAPETMNVWAEVLRRNGRTVVSWNPGEDFRTGGDRVSMLWSMNRAETIPTDDHPMFDACGWYIEDFEPFELLGAAAYSRPFQGHGPDPRQLGAIFCGWHDSAVGLPHRRLLAQQQVLPACLLLGDSFWHGREHVEDFTRRKLPSPDDPRLAVAADLERRVALHRDRVLDCPGQAFHFLRQTQMRWRLSETDGTLIAKDVPQASVFPYYGEGRRQNRYHSPTGTVVAETWILSPDDRTVGAWIGFTGYDRDNGRFRTKGTPALGEWNKFGATIELNGERIPPPAWKQPSMDAGKVIKAFTYAREIDEVPYTNDEYYMREPTEVRLRKGWNHVRMVLPMPVKANTWRSPRWVGTFIPVAGTTDRPRDVEDLRYSSEPPRHILVRDFRTVKDGQVVSFNIGTAAHGPATLAVLQRHLPGVRLSLWADAPLAPELQRMMDRRFPDVKIHTGPDVPETDAELLLVGSGASIAGSVRRSIGPWRERTGRPVAAYAIGYGKGIAELTRAMSFCSFRDRTALARAQGDRAAPAATGFAPDAVFDFDAADETGAAAFLEENGLEPGRFVCAIPGQRATSYWIYFGGKRDEKRETLNARHELSDNAIVCAAIVEAVRKHGLKVLLCAEHRGEMPLIERALLAQLPEDVKASCVPLREFWSPDLALGVYRRSRCVFGIEMHSQVMAIGNGVPAVVMRHSGFGSKSGMWNDVGLGEWLMDIDDAGAAERAAAIVGGILSDEAAAKAKVAAARAAIDAAAADAVRRLAAARPASSR